MDQRPPSPAVRAEVAALVDAWLDREIVTNPIVDAVERMPDRWFVRVVGEDKDVSTIWFTLRQRTLHYETYVMPAPEEHHARFYEQFLRRNYGLGPVAFAIGPEDAVFLSGETPLTHVDERHLDEVLGTIWATVEQSFRAALRIGFASRFGG